MNQPTEYEFGAVQHGKLGDVVYQKLADALIKGALRPDTRLRIRDLAQKMGTSVTPVREAMLRLIQDGALVMRTARDIRVPILDADRYLEIRSIRLELEGLAAQNAAQTAGVADIERLETLVAANETAIRERDFEDATEKNQLFHFALAEIAGMPVLGGILRSLWMQMGPVISAAYEGGGRTMIDQHYVVLDALRERNGRAAKDAIRHDILLGGDVILKGNILSGTSSRAGAGGAAGAAAGD